MTSTANDVAWLEPGTELEPLVRETDFDNWNRYAAVNDEFVPIHMDDEAGRAAGMPGAFGMGNLQWSYLHNLLRSFLDHLAGQGRIVSLTCEFRAPNLKGSVTARGTVTGVRHEDGNTVVNLDVWTENADGKPIAKGAATVEIEG